MCIRRAGNARFAYPGSPRRARNDDQPLFLRSPAFSLLPPPSPPPSSSSSTHTNMMRKQILATALRARPVAAQMAPRLVRMSSSGHGQETFESFTERYVQFFQGAQDLFEVQRGLNNCFAHDLVPAPAVVEAALRASRRVNDFATAVRVFEGVREKVENKQQYQAYLDELKGVREELGTSATSTNERAVIDNAIQVLARWRSFTPTENIRRRTSRIQVRLSVFLGDTVLLIH